MPDLVQFIQSAQDQPAERQGGEDQVVQQGIPDQGQEGGEGGGRGQLHPPTSQKGGEEPGQVADEQHYLHQQPGQKEAEVGGRVAGRAWAAGTHLEQKQIIVTCSQCSASQSGLAT